MTKQEFIFQLENPETVSTENINDIQNVIGEFPYFQSARILLTKAFHSSGNMNFENELKKTAAYVSDRKKLHSTLFIVKGIQEKESAEKTQPLEERPVNVEEIPESTNDELLNDLNPIDELENQILSSAINSSILLEVSDEIPDVNEISSVEIAKPFEENNFDDSVSNPFNDEQEHSFSDWINFFGDGENIDSLNQEHVVQFNDDIIEVSSNKEKAEFYSASKMAKLSVQEDDDLVTETLASIYADQGNFDKAIKAFEKLQLKYPEKRVYFAGRIKKIQNQLNQ